MAQNSQQKIAPPGKLEIPKAFYAVGAVLFLIGAAAFAAGLFSDPYRAWKGYVIGFWFTLSLGMAGPLFVATQYLSKASWSVPIRRIPEAFGTFLIPAILLGLIGLLGIDYLYDWLNQSMFDPASPNFDPIAKAKEGVLQRSWMWVGTLGSLIVMAGLAFWMRSNSIKQDESGDVALWRKNIWISALFLFTFVIAISILSWYWLMSFNPHWYSTMWAVYAFAGLFQSGLALMAIILVWMRKKGLFGGVVGDDQLHALGQLVFGFTVFYAYIGFSQFLLIWYAHMPETTEWYYFRFNFGWGGYMLMLPILKFIVPFLLLLPQDHKKNKRNILVIISSLLIVMQIYEIWIWVAPYGLSASNTDFRAGLAPTLPILEIGITLGFIGLFMVVVSTALARQKLAPVKDPLLAEALPQSRDHLVYPNGKPSEVV